MKLRKDEDVIAAASLFYHMSQSALPSEIMEASEEALMEYQMPRMATQQVAPGEFNLYGFSFLLNYVYLQGLGSILYSKGRHTTSPPQNVVHLKPI